MKKLRILAVMILCVSLLAFAGCGDNGAANDDADNGSVVEETTNGGNDNGDGNTLEDGADDIVDDAKDAVDDMDGKDTKESETKNN